MMKLLLPEGEQVKDTLVHLDMVIKFQTILYEFHSVMYWMSLSEIVLLGVLLIFFLRSPGQMWYVILHVPHLVRGIIGMGINKIIPRSHDIVEKLKPSDEEAGKQITFEGFEMRMQTVILTSV